MCCRRPARHPVRCGLLASREGGLDGRVRVGLASPAEGSGARPLGGLEHRAGAAFGQPGRSDRGLETAPDAQSPSYLCPRNTVNSAVSRIADAATSSSRKGRRRLQADAHATGRTMVLDEVVLTKKRCW